MPNVCCLLTIFIDSKWRYFIYYETHRKFPIPFDAFDPNMDFLNIDNKIVNDSDDWLFGKSLRFSSFLFLPFLFDFGFDPSDDGPDLFRRVDGLVVHVIILEGQQRIHSFHSHSGWLLL